MFESRGPEETLARRNSVANAIMDYPTAQAASENALGVIGAQAMLTLENTMLKVAMGVMKLDARARGQGHLPEPEVAGLINGDLSNGIVGETSRRCQVRCNGRTLHLTKRTKMSFEEMLNEVQAAGEAGRPIVNRRPH
jgi:hypothetical protein